MIPSLDDLSLFQNQDGLGIFHCGKPVSDDENRPVLHKGIHAFLDESFRAGIDGAGSLVQNQHRRPGNRSPGDRQKIVGTVIPE